MLSSKYLFKQLTTRIVMQPWWNHFTSPWPASYASLLTLPVCSRRMRRESRS